MKLTTITVGNREIKKITDARIIFRNFSGKPDKFHKNGGYRSFNVIIDDPEAAQKLGNEKWNVRIMPPRDDEEPNHRLEVCVSYELRAPKIVMISERGEVDITEDNIEILDFVDIDHVDFKINPRFWTDDNGEEHIKAYLYSMAVYAIEDDLFY